MQLPQTKVISPSKFEERGDETQTFDNNTKELEIKMKETKTIE